MSDTDTTKLYDFFERCSGVSTDSRRVEPGNLFFALRGDNFDGNQYAAAAIERGARYAVVDDPKVAVNSRFILVNDALTALQQLANFYRNRHYIPVLAITGSNGKTTTKELIATVLGSVYRVHYTRGNFNNHIGVPLTLLRMPADTEVAVIEMGANHVGEIAELCAIAEPTHGLITNIGSAHLEGFGGLKGIKKGKSELYRYLERTKGMAFVNMDQPHLPQLAQGVEWRLDYGRTADQPRSESYSVDLIGADPYVRVSFRDENRNTYVVQSQLIGRYNYPNIEAAIVLGRYFKVPAARIGGAIEQYRPDNNRSEILEKEGNFFILDAYNANPTSVGYALENLKGVRPDTPKIAVLGEMLELGKYSKKEHQKIAARAAKAKFEWVFLVGEEFGRIELPNERFRYFATTEELREFWKSEQFSGYTVLVKGSRGVKLEALVNEGL